MNGQKTTTKQALFVVSAGLMLSGQVLTPIHAADLGGDCCADLEERVLELEETTARKGNRKVSLKVSGHITRVFGWWEDDFGDSEFYAAGWNPSGSRLQFSGKAKLSSNWTAGYVFRMRFNGDRTGDGFHTVTGASGLGSDVVQRDKNYAYLTHARLGTVATGHMYTPTDDITQISLGGHGVMNNDSTKWNRSTVSGFELEQDSPHQAIAYISPTMAGFTFSIAWADLNLPSSFAGSSDSATDMIDMAVRYANEFGPIRIAAGIGYTTIDSDDNVAVNDGSNLMGAIAVLHTPTGLNMAFSAGTEIDDGLVRSDGSPGNRANTDAVFWHLEAGITQNFFGPGKTALYGEYGEYDYDDPNYAFRGISFAEDTMKMWGLGVVQHFDSAATELFLAYRHWEQDADAAGIAAGHDGDVNQVVAGMRIKY